MTKFRIPILMALWILLCSLSPFVQGQDPVRPVTRTYAIRQATIVQAPGRILEVGTVVIRDGLIQAVGKNVAIPPDAVVVSGDSLFVYAGFIDGLSRAGVARPKEENRQRPPDPGNPTAERAGITPQIDVRFGLNPDDKALEELRQSGFTLAHVVPYGGMLPGQAALLFLHSGSATPPLFATKTALYSELTGASGVYPNTVIGVMAKWRDLYRQASLSRQYESVYASNRSGLERPVANHLHEAFYPVIDQRMPVLFKAERLLDVQRVLMLKNDLKFPLILADVKQGWPMMEKIRASGAKVFLTLDLPEAPKADNAKKASKEKTWAEEENDRLEKRKSEAVAAHVAQAAAFHQAGIPFGFATLSAKPKDIPAALRRMIAAGLPEDAALAALTTQPAQLLGISDRLGTVEAGKMANLVITRKPYFHEKAQVRYVFVDGYLHTYDWKPERKTDPNAKVNIEGNWSIEIRSPQGNSTSQVLFKKETSGYTGTITSSMNPEAVSLKDIALEGNRLSFRYTWAMGGRSIDVEVSATVEGESFSGNMSVGTFGSFPVEGTKNPK